MMLLLDVLCVSVKTKYSSEVQRDDIHVSPYIGKAIKISQFFGDCAGSTSVSFAGYKEVNKVRGNLILNHLEHKKQKNGVRSKTHERGCPSTKHEPYPILLQRASK
jgi:hypothetical protein